MLIKSKNKITFEKILGIIHALHIVQSFKALQLIASKKADKAEIQLWI